MKGYINNIDFVNIEPMKYWSVPANKSAEQASIVQNAIFSGEYGGSLKVDGYYERFIKDEDGECFLIARSRNVHGEVVNKLEWLPQITDWMNSLPNGTCFLTECYHPGAEGSKGITSILGCLKEKAIARQKGDPLHLYVFDVMAYNGETYLNTPYFDRIHKVMELANQYKSEVIDYATYYTGKELWDALQEYLASGREGMVIMRNDAMVYQKRTPARVSIKCKKELAEYIDVVIIGVNAPTRQSSTTELELWPYWMNEKTGEKIGKNMYKEYVRGDMIIPITKSYYYGWAGSFKIGLYDNQGNIHHIGDLSGLTDEMKENWKSYINRVATIGAMEIMDTGGLRHPKLICIRDIEDKNPQECSLAQISEL